MKYLFGGAVAAVIGVLLFLLVTRWTNWKAFIDWLGRW